MTQNSATLLNYVQENGGKISIDELVTALGRDKRSINASVTDICYRDAEGVKFKKEEGKTGLATRVVEGEGDDKVTYVVLTEIGKTFTPADAE